MDYDDKPPFLAAWQKVFKYTNYYGCSCKHCERRQKLIDAVCKRPVGDYKLKLKEREKLFRGVLSVLMLLHHDFQYTYVTRPYIEQWLSEFDYLIMCSDAESVDYDDKDYNRDEFVKFWGANVGSENWNVQKFTFCEYDIDDVFFPMLKNMVAEGVVETFDQKDPKDKEVHKCYRAAGRFAFDKEWWH